MEEKDAAKHQNATKQNIPRRGNNNERATNSGGGYGVSKRPRPRPSTMPKAPKQRGATQRKSIKNREGRKTSGRDGEAASATSAVARSDAASSPVYEPRASCRVYHFLPPLPKCPSHRLSGVYGCRGIILSVAALLPHAYVMGNERLALNLTTEKGQEESEGGRRQKGGREATTSVCMHAWISMAVRRSVRRSVGA